MKRRIRLTEGDLHRIVKNSVNRILKESKPNRRRMIREGHSEGEWLERWDQLIEILGEDGMLQELWNCLDGNEIEEDIRWIARQHDLEDELGLIEYDDEDDIDDEEYDYDDEEPYDI